MSQKMHFKFNRYNAGKIWLFLFCIIVWTLNSPSSASEEPTKSSWAQKCQLILTTMGDTKYLWFNRLKNRFNISSNQFNTSRQLTGRMAIHKPRDESGKKIVVNGSYELLMGDRFITKLRELTEDQHYIEFGAGSELAIYDFLTWHKQNITTPPKTTAIGYKLPRTHFSKENSHLSPKHSTRLGFAQKMRIEEFEPATLISDPYGPLHYVSKDFQKVLQLELDLLKRGGLLVTPFPGKTHFEKENGVLITFYDFLLTIPGLVVDKIGSIDGGVLYIRKLQDQVIVPPLELLDFELIYGPLPHRIYKMSPSARRLN